MFCKIFIYENDNEVYASCFCEWHDCSGTMLNNLELLLSLFAFRSYESLKISKTHTFRAGLQLMAAVIFYAIISFVFTIYLRHHGAPISSIETERIERRIRHTDEDEEESLI